MTRTLGAVLEERAAGLLGRDRERSALLELVEREQPAIAFVHGVGGVGKTSLMAAAAADARARGALTITLDARAIEPSPAGFLSALRAALKLDETADPVAALADHRGRAALFVDTAELLGLLDSWLRDVLLPALPAHVRVVLAGRLPPGAAWTQRFAELLRVLALQNLEADHAHEILRRAGLDEQEGRRVNRVARGHPLCLQLAAAARTARPRDPLEEAAVAPAVEELARVYLDGLDPATRRALDAAAVVRRTTLSLLGAMLPDEAPQEAFERVRRLPFVALHPDGLLVHDTVREVLLAQLRAFDPPRLHRLRAGAWRQLRREERYASAAGSWRSTTDLLYLTDNEQLRQLFFPPAFPGLLVERARPDDEQGIVAISDRYDPPGATRVLRAWLAAAPQAFVVARAAGGEIVGFLGMSEPADVPTRVLAGDPVASRWRDHLRAHPVARGQTVLFGRHFLTRDAGDGTEAGSPAQAALFLEAMRMCMQRRPRLARVYGARRTVDAPWLRPLGYEILDEPPVELDGQSLATIVNDMGPESVDGWVSTLVAAELGEEPVPLDAASRQLVLDGRRVDLTKLEFDVLHYLHQRAGQAVGREALLRDVWGYDWTGGSNVVDVVISSLRRKLEDRADALETVRGLGYRLRALA